MNFTDHYSLQKPISEEKYDVNVSNMNMDLIDSALNRIELQNQTQDNLLATKEALDSETARATEKENELSENINAETARAENAETEISNQLDMEITRAMQAEETVSNNLEAHITSSSAHNDIRLLISGLTTRLNTLADSDDTTLDQLSEIVAYIKNNKSLIDGITTGKVNVSDIIDNLTSTAANKPLSGKQGKELKDLIDALTTAVGNKVDKISGKGLSANDYTTADKNKLSGIAAGAEVNVQSDWNVTDPTSDAYIKNKPTAFPANGGNADKVDGYHAAAFGQQVHYSTKNQNTGYYKIKINSLAAYMVSFDIKLYQSYKASTISISGYNYVGSNSHWNNPKARIIDSDLGSMEVKFGYDSDNMLWIAIPAGNYTGLTICNINNGYDQIADWSNQFTITNVSSLTGTVQSTQTAYSPWKRDEVIPVSKGGTGKTTAKEAANVLINELVTGDASVNPTDTQTYITHNGEQWVIRKLSTLWNYIKSKLATVATSGSYNDLSNKPSIPSVGNGTVTIKQAGTQKGTFTMNQSGNTTIELTDNNTTYTPASAAPKANGTAAVGASAKYAREDHVHPLQTTVSGNAGSASRLADRGNVTAETGANLPAVAGLSMSRAYNNGYPVAYGNVLTARGGGMSQLLMGWSGTDGAVASLYYRNKRDNAAANWSAWKQIAFTDSNISGTAATANHLNAQNIATNTNLNSLTATGFYYCPANATVATFTNSPTTNAFFMIVGKHAGVYQEVIEYMTASPKRYMRNYYNNTWGSWYRVYTTADAPPDTKYSLPLMTASVRGGAKIGYTANGKNYPVQLSNEQMYVNVPWTDTNTTYSNMTGATASAAGKAGLVPAPAAGKQTSFLRGDGEWDVVVRGIKGSKESSYRAGFINITPANIGALAIDGNAASATKATQDGKGNVIADTYVPKNESRNVILPEYIAKSINANNYISTNSATLDNAILCGRKNSINKSDTGAPSFNTAILGGQNNSIESGYSSVILGGEFNTIKGSSSNSAIIAGNNLICSLYQIGTGHYNDDSKITATSGTGTGTCFFIGNGTSTAKSNAIRGDYNGKLWCKAAYSATGADYAELFEWEDGNPDNEDRRGYFVTMSGDKIRKAQPGDYILGIVSANPCVLGNTDMEWQGQFLKDEFGAYLNEEFTETVTRTRYVPETDEDGNPVLDENGVQQEIPEEYEEEITGTRYVLNPDYDPDAPYVDRMSRLEWDAVGMMGVLAVYDDGTCEVNGFCTCGANGLATASDSGYRIVKRVADNIVRVIFK